MNLGNVYLFTIIIFKYCNFTLFVNPQMSLHQLGVYIVSLFLYVEAKKNEHILLQLNWVFFSTDFQSIQLMLKFLSISR